MIFCEEDSCSSVGPCSRLAVLQGTSQVLLCVPIHNALGYISEDWGRGFLSLPWGNKVTEDQVANESWRCSHFFWTLDFPLSVITAGVRRLR